MKSAKAGEQKLRHAQRLAMLGDLTCGLGHDMRNLLMPAMLRLDALAAATDVPPQVRHDLADIRLSIESLQQLAEGLRLLSADPYRKQSDRQTTRLREWWRDFKGIAADALTANTMIDARFPSDATDAAIPPGVLSHVVLTALLHTRRSLSRVEQPRVTILLEVIGDELRITLKGNGMRADGVTRRTSVDLARADAHDRSDDDVSSSAIGDMQSLIRHYRGDLVIATTEEGTSDTVIRLRAVTAATTHGTIRSAVVRIIDARQLALVNRMLLRRGIHVATGTEQTAPDVVISDRPSLPAVLREFQQSAHAPPRIIALGLQDALDAQHVQWVNLNSPGQLDDVLAPDGDLPN